MGGKALADGLRRLRRHSAAALLALIVPPGMSAPLPASGSGAPPQVGVGTAEAGMPANAAEARAAFDETVRKCRLLQVKAVRDECLRQAERDLQHHLQHLQSAGTPASGAPR